MPAACRRNIRLWDYRTETKEKMKRSLCAWVLGVLIAGVSAGTAHQAESNVANWANHNNTSDETAYSPLDQINRSNVSKLGLAWYLDLPDERMLEATPLAVDGVIYFTGSYAAVYAVDALSGKLLWKYDPEVWKHGPQKMRFMLPDNRGVAYADGRLFVGTLDGRLIALNAKSGSPLWSVQTTALQSIQTITGAPRVFDGKVIIGNGGSDFGARGYVTAYDAATGRQAWRFYMAPGSPLENHGNPAMERAAATWKGSYWKTGTGGCPWDSITFDNELNRIYVGTGNASPYDPEARSPGGGDNLYTASIVALDADTGAYIWHYQINPRDAWDFDSTQQMILADLSIGGRMRKVLMQAPKNGFFYVIDRENGKVISTGKIGKATWADRIDPITGRPVEEKNIRYQNGEITIWPSPAGAHSWQSMSFSPKTGLVYIPTMQIGMHYAKHAGQKAAFGGVSMTIVKADPEDGKGALLAWDPVREKAVWKVHRAHLWNGGTLATGGGLVFQGTADGAFSAYDALSGESLWHFGAGLGIIAAPISYSVNGRQYVSVLVGYGASNTLGDIMNVGWKYGAQPRRLLTFVLDGTAGLPRSTPPDISVHPVDNAAIKIDPADAAAGDVLFTMNCSGCHGLNVISAGAPAPDLRESRVALDRKSLWAVLHDGVLLPRGMPQFAQLDRTQVHEIYAYIRAQARQALAPPSKKGS
jgi:quinohemoprotein ethanol dehydrogenase